MSFLPHKKFTWADFGGYIPISPRRYAPGMDELEKVFTGRNLRQASHRTPVRC